MINQARAVIALRRVLVVIGLAGALVACGEGDRNTLSVALFQAPSSDALIELIPEFEEETGVKVEYDVLPYADLKTKVEQQFYARSGTYDVVMADCIWIPSFAERGYLQEVDETAWLPGEYDFEDLLPALDDYLGHYPKGGTRYGMPFMSNTHMMTYRPTMIQAVVDKLGLDLPGETPESTWTWDQYLQVAQAVQEDLSAAGVDAYGSSLQARAGAWLIYEWYSVLFGFVTDDEARATGLPAFDAPAAAAMAYYAQLYDDAAPKGALTWGHEEETAAMCSGRTAMDATSNVELAANLLAEECQTAGPLAFAYPPIGASGKASPDMGGYGLLLSADSDMPDQASAFVLWAASKDVHARVVAGGGSPVRKSEVRNPDVLEQFPYLAMYEQLIEDSIYRARVAFWPELQDVLSRELTAVMKGDKAAAAATAEVRAWLESRAAN